MEIPEFHGETNKGKRGDTFWYWWSHRGTKYRSKRFKTRDARDNAILKEEAKYATNVLPRLTSLTDEQVKEAEMCRKFADDHGVPKILEALTFYHKNYRAALKGPKLNDATKRFLEDRRVSGLTERSMIEYEGHFKDLKEALGEEFPTGTLTVERAREYLHKWSTMSLLTYSHRRRTMSALWQWLADHEEVPKNPITKIPNPNNNGKLSRGKVPGFYTVAEAHSLLKAAKKTELISFFALSLFGGVRTDEIMRLEESGGWKCVNFETGRITIDGKIGGRSLTMNDTLRAWLKDIEPKQKPFFSKSHWYLSKKLKHSVLGEDRAKLSNLARHSYITYALNLPGASYAQVAKNCGNSESVIKTHYEGNATAPQAEAYFALTPRKVR